jgi:predicted TIM-barrel fold metal-dependent hydrolase
MDSILETRLKLDSMNLFEDIVKKHRIEEVFIDDGFCSKNSYTITEINRKVRAQKVLRIETLLETSLNESVNYSEMRDILERSWESLAPQSVALKSIIAYRSGLSIDPATQKEVKESFDLYKSYHISSPYKGFKPLLDDTFLFFCEKNREKRLPFQIHTGYGDRDIDIIKSNPALLKPIFEDERYRDIPFILLHTGYPYCRETGFLSATYRNVYADFGLSVPYLSISGIENALEALLEVSPVDKILFSSDAHFLPEWFFLAIKWAKRIVSNLLRRSLLRHEISMEYALASLAGIFHDNAQRIYVNRGA